MDLGIAGRKAIVCASSRGLGRACAMRLAEAGCEVVVNGRDPNRLDATAADIRKATGAKVLAVAADVATPEGQASLFAACPEPDILIANNAGPPFRDFRELDRQKMIDGVIGNMIVPVELLQRAIDPMIKNKFGRIVNITSGSVAQHNVTINFMLPGPFDTDRLRSNHEITAKKQGISVDEALKHRMTTIPARRLGQADEFGATCAFLCSTHAGFITGQNILMDGGIFPGAF
jgi:3-oxoacyl-[acyl-carrier protein] reductase